MSSVRNLKLQKERPDTGYCSSSISLSRFTRTASLKLRSSLDNPNIREMQRMFRDKQNDQKPKPKAKLLKPIQEPAKVANPSTPSENINKIHLLDPEAYKQLDEYFSEKYKDAEETSPENCPLNSNEMPVVSEFEHCVGYCYCHYCTCDEHICPSKSRINPGSPRAVWSTNYQQTYKEHKNILAATALSFKDHNEYNPSHFKIESITTQKSDFVPHKVELKPKEPKQLPAYKFDFIPRSSYQVNFPYWKSGQIERIGHSYLPYRGQIVKLQGDSTYKTHFQEHEIIEDKKSYIPTDNHPITPLKQFFSETTSKREFRKYRPSDINRAIEFPIEEYRPVQSTKSHYSTTYQNEYIPKTPSCTFKSRKRLSSRY